MGADVAAVLAVMLCYERHGSGIPAEQEGACPNCQSRAEQVWAPRLAPLIAAREKIANLVGFEAGYAEAMERVDAAKAEA